APLPTMTARRGGVLVMRHDRERPQLVIAALRALRHAGLWLRPASAWADHDAAGRVSALVRAELVTSAHPPGWVQLRVRRRVTTHWASAALVVAGAAAVSHHPLASLVVLALGVVDVTVGGLRCALRAPRALQRAGATANVGWPTALDADVVGSEVD